MLMIRLQRVGRKNDPSFRVVVVEKERATRTGNVIEFLGNFNPRFKEKAVLNAERIIYWIGNGAQPTATMHNMLVRSGVLKEKYINKAKKQKKAEVKTMA